MAVENLQGELQRVTKTLDLQESLVNGWVGEFWLPLPFIYLPNFSTTAPIIVPPIAPRTIIGA
jgi:hypothetical protein